MLENFKEFLNMFYGIFILHVAKILEGAALFLIVVTF